MQHDVWRQPDQQGDFGSGLHRPADRAWQHAALLRQGRPPDRDRADDPAPFTVGILDLDGFKPINDLFGHKAGDDILIQVAMRLRAAMDGHSAVTRVGADEFAFLFRWCSARKRPAKSPSMLIEILSAPYDVGERTARLSASVGCSLFYSGDETTEILVNKAETALYQAKRSGRGRVVVYTREMEEAAKRVTRIEQALRRAVSAGEVEPHFQPIVDLNDRRVIGFETLARWTDRDLGMRAAVGLHPDRRGARHHRPAVAAGAAQGDRGGAQLAAGPVPVVQPVAVAAGRPEYRPAHTGDPRPHRLRSAPARDRDHRNRPDDRSGLGREDRRGSAPRRHPRLARRFRHRPVRRSAACANSISTSSRSTAPSSPRSSTTARPSTSSAPSWPCAKDLAWMSSPKASRRKRKPNG